MVKKAVSYLKKARLEHPLPAGGLEFETFSRLYRREVCSLSRLTDELQSCDHVLSTHLRSCDPEHNICDTIYVVHRYCTIS